MTAERRESMLIAVESSHGFDDLRALVKRYLDSGIPSGQLLEDLSQIRALVPDDVEETVLDVMDLLVDWCAPVFKLSSRETDEPSLLSYDWIVSSYGPGAWLCMPSWGGGPLMTKHLAFYSVVRITRSTRTANVGIDGLNGVVGGISDSGSHVEVRSHGCREKLYDEISEYIWVSDNSSPPDFDPRVVSDPRVPYFFDPRSSLPLDQVRDALEEFCRLGTEDRP